VTDEPDPFPLKNDLRQIRPGSIFYPTGSFFYLQGGRKTEESLSADCADGEGKRKKTGKVLSADYAEGDEKTGDVLSADYTDYADEEEGDEKRCPVCAWIRLISRGYGGSIKQGKKNGWEKVPLAGEGGHHDQRNRPG
jgi:hypothetical protein